MKLKNVLIVVNYMDVRNISEEVSNEKMINIYGTIGPVCTNPEI